MLWKPSLLKVLRDRESQLWVDLAFLCRAHELAGGSRYSWASDATGRSQVPRLTSHAVMDGYLS